MRKRSTAPKVQEDRPERLDVVAGRVAVGWLRRAIVNGMHEEIWKQPGRMRPRYLLRARRSK